MPKCLLELLGLLLELLMELPLLQLDALHHVLILWGRERPPYNYVRNPYSRSNTRSSSSLSSNPNNSKDILAISLESFRLL